MRRDRGIIRARPLTRLGSHSAIPGFETDSSRPKCDDQFLKLLIGETKSDVGDYGSTQNDLAFRRAILQPFTKCPLVFGPRNDPTLQY